MEGINSVFPVPIYFDKIEIEDIVVPHFGEEQNVLRQEVPVLKDKVFEVVSELIKSLGYVDQPLKLNDMWFNRYDKNRPFLEHHYHQNCSWTGCYFPEDANHQLVIYNPMANVMQQHYPQITDITEFNTEVLPFNGIMKNSLMIFPSYLAHQVMWNGGDPSHSISFDIAYQLPIGDKEYGSYSE